MSESAVSAKRGWGLFGAKTGAVRNARLSRAGKRRPPERSAVEDDAEGPRCSGCSLNHLTR